MMLPNLRSTLEHLFTNTFLYADVNHHWAPITNVDVDPNMDK